MSGDAVLDLKGVVHAGDDAVKVALGAVGLSQV
jgi:hypothetical protein